MVLQNTSYIALSEQLRQELELKIDRLYSKKRFHHYSIINLTRCNDEIEYAHIPLGNGAIIISRPVNYCKA
jgi:hypothetical protein